MLDTVLAATADLDVTVLYATTARPFDRAALRAHRTGELVVLVEPYQAGTSSAEVAAALEDTPHRVLALGVPNVEHRHYGTWREHDRAHGLDARGIRASIERAL
jgi:transketolase